MIVLEEILYILLKEYACLSAIFTKDLGKVLKRVIESDSAKATPMALKVVANIAVHPEHHHLIHDTGIAICLLLMCLVFFSYWIVNQGC